MKSAAKNPRADALFRAFADRTRLRLLNLLRGGELCVCDLVDVIGAPQPTVSRHLAYLRRCGLVRVRKEGLWSYYRLAKPFNALHDKLLACLGCCGGEIPELADDARRLARVQQARARSCFKPM
jgi:ArsR family transcriptional regulator